MQHSRLNVNVLAVLFSMNRSHNWKAKKIWNEFKRQLLEAAKLKTVKSQFSSQLLLKKPDFFFRGVGVGRGGLRLDSNALLWRSSCSALPLLQTVALSPFSMTRMRCSERQAVFCEPSVRKRIQ